MPKARIIYDAIPLWDLADGCVVDTRGGLSGVARVYGVDPIGLNSDDWGTLATALYRAFASLPDRVRLTWHVLHRPANAADFRPALRPQSEPLLDEMAAARQAYLASRPHQVSECYLAFSDGRVLGEREFVRVTRKQHVDRVRSLEKLARELSGLLRPAGLEFERLDSPSIWALYNMMLGEPEGPGLMQSLYAPSPREQLARWECDAADRYVRTGRRYRRVLACKTLPETTHLNYLAKLAPPIGTGTIRYTIHQRVLPRTQAKLEFEQQRKFASSLAGLSLQKGGAVDQGKLKGFAEYDAAGAKLVDGAILTQLGFQVVVEGQSVAELDDRSEAIASVLREHDVVCFEETAAHHREFWKTLPGLERGFDRWHRPLHTTASDLVPIQTVPRGDVEPDIFFSNALTGEPFGFSLHGAGRANYNFLVLGASGAGKSVLYNMLLAHVMLSGPWAGPVFVIDYAGPDKSSGKTAAQVFGGTYITVLGGGVQLNPWDLKTDAWVDGTVRQETLAFLTQILNLLLYNDGQSREDALFEAIIQRAIIETYQRYDGEGAPLFSDLLPVLRDFQTDSSFDPAKVRLLCELLQKFIASPAAAILNRPGTLARDAKFVVYDLFGLRDYDDRTCAAITGTVLRFVRNIAFDGRPERKKYVLMDEVTNLLNIGMRPLVEELLTTARAHGCVVGVATQNYTEYRRSAIAETVNLNTSTHVLMSHARATNAKEPVIQDLGLSAEEAALFRELRAVKGEYSELLLRTQCWSPEGGRDVSVKLRFELAPFEYWVVTSDSNDRAKVQALQKKAPKASKVELLRFLAKERERKRRSA